MELHIREMTGLDWYARLLLKFSQFYVKMGTGLCGRQEEVVFFPVEVLLINSGHKGLSWSHSPSGWVIPLGEGNPMWERVTSLEEDHMVYPTWGVILNGEESSHVRMDHTT